MSLFWDSLLYPRWYNMYLSLFLLNVSAHLQVNETEEKKIVMKKNIYRERDSEFALK